MFHNLLSTFLADFKPLVGKGFAMTIRRGAFVIPAIATLLAVSGCVSAPYAGYVPRPGQGPVVGNSFVSAMLAMHNHERTRLGLEPLEWGPALAEAAGGYATTLAATGIFRHPVKSARQGQGENLWMGSRGAYDLPQMMDGWLGERPLFQPGIFPNVSRDGNWAAVGHYTQIIWRGTTSVGCAVRSNPASDYLVCRYSPPGNVTGKPVS